METARWLDLERYQVGGRICRSTQGGKKELYHGAIGSHCCFCERKEFLGLYLSGNNNKLNRMLGKNNHTIRRSTKDFHENDRDIGYLCILRIRDLSSL